MRLAVAGLGAFVGIAVGVLAIGRERPVLLLAAGAFTLIPVGYAFAALVRRRPGLPRAPLSAAAALGLVAVAAASVVVLGSCHVTLGPDASLGGCDFSGEDLRGLDLSGADLREADLREADLREADLSGVDLTGARLEDAIVEGVEWAGAILAAAKLGDLGLARVEMAGVDLHEADLAGADLERADLSGANLAGADLSRAQLAGVDLRDADLSGARLVSARLDGAQLGGATVAGAVLSDASLVDAELDAADLSGANLAGADLSDVGARDASITDAVVDGADLTGAVLAATDLSGTPLAGTTLEGTSLIEATGLSDADLASALGVPEADLGAALAAARVPLEPASDVLDALGAACDGAPVPGAGAFPTGDVRSTTVLDDRGGPSEVARSMPADWEPMAVRFAQLVACVGAERTQVVETCRYFVIDTGAAGSTVRRLRYSLDARVVEARTGDVVDSRTFEGSLPRQCDPVITSVVGQDQTIEGTHVRVGEIRSWLEGFAG